MRWSIVALPVFVVLRSSAALADSPSTADAKSYCEWQESVAASTSLLLVAPSAYVTAGYVSGADASSGGSALPPTQRIIAGAAYSFGGLNQGLAIRDQAHAECARYAVESELRTFIERNRDGESVRALTAKLKVLDDALPRATELVRTQRVLLAQSRLTVDELGATELRAETLREEASETRRDLEALSALPAEASRPVAQALAARDQVEEDAERADGRVRTSHGWDLALRGGYDRLFGVRDSTPVYAMATATVDVGWFFQGSANSDARDARRTWVHHEIEGLDDRVQQVVERLRAMRRAETKREHETATLLADIEARFKAVSAIPGDKARSFADAVWFDLTRVRADHAYASEHRRELAKLLGDAVDTP